MTATAQHPHRVAHAVAEVRESLGNVAGVPLWSKDAEQTAATLTEVQAAPAQLAELETRLLLHAHRADLPGRTGATSTPNGFAHHTHTSRPQAHRQWRLATGLETHHQTRAALAAGTLQVEQAQAVLRSLAELPDDLDPDQVARVEAHLLDLAHDVDAQQLRLRRSFLRASAGAELTRAARAPTALPSRTSGSADARGVHTLSSYHHPLRLRQSSSATRPLARHAVQVSVQLLDEATAARLRAAPFTYTSLGHTTQGPPPGFAWFERTATLRRLDFDQAAHDLLSWRVQVGAGLRVWASETPLRQETVVVMRLGPGRASLKIPCRVVNVVDEPSRCGFTYGTLPGHPEAGEERFLLQREADGLLSMTITAFSRPSSRLAVLSGPIGRRVQSMMTERYLRALDVTPTV